MRTFTTKAGWVIASLLGLTLIAVWAGVIQAGPLDPPGAPSPSMKSLDDLPPSWHRTLPSSGGCTSERFACVLGGEAVLDRETGLVWERTPQTSTVDWDSAVRQCQQAYHGGRMGWRLPTAAELMTLADTTSVVTGLPPGHPFTLGAVDDFWTANENTASPTTRGTRFRFSAFLTFDDLKSSAYRAWCVRGAGGIDKD